MESSIVTPRMVMELLVSVNKVDETTMLLVTHDP
ncbi:hypothetical protein SAMN05444972_107161 [Marininema halotolerans]|uniref:Uncharacterized protein n=1 Tax=Marininema halotolerans TaxID=1155944 RepID=A0A1I6SKV8_9BACL|nr:hypothetical protein SAMN05444972_107161 [Marininema halotolerans]